MIQMTSINYFLLGYNCLCQVNQDNVKTPTAQIHQKSIKWIPNNMRQRTIITLKKKRTLCIKTMICYLIVMSINQLRQDRGHRLVFQRSRGNTLIKGRKDKHTLPIRKRQNTSTQNKISCPTSALASKIPTQSTFLVRNPINHRLTKKEFYNSKMSLLFSTKNLCKKREKFAKKHRKCEPQEQENSQISSCKPNAAAMKS